MPGIYGNSAEDRAREKELNAYLRATVDDDDDAIDKEMEAYDRAEEESDRRYDEQKDMERMAKK